MLRLVPEVGLKFALNDQFRTVFTPSDGRPIGFEGRLAAGAATGILKVRCAKSYSDPCCPRWDCSGRYAATNGTCRKPAKIAN